MVREVLAATQDQLAQTQFLAQLLLMAAGEAAGLLRQEMGLMVALEVVLEVDQVLRVLLALEILLRHHRAKETMAV